MGVGSHKRSMVSVAARELHHRTRDSIKGTCYQGNSNRTDDQHTLLSLEVLTLVVRYQGRNGEAEKLNRRALEGREELGVQHLDTLTSVHSLAHLLHT